MAREKGDPENNPLPTKLQPGDTVLVQKYTKGLFDPQYVGDYGVVAIKENQVEIRPSVGGPTEMKLRLNHDGIPDLHWSLTDSYHTTNIG